MSHGSKKDSSTNQTEQRQLGSKNYARHCFPEYILRDKYDKAVQEYGDICRRGYSDALYEYDSYERARNIALNEIQDNFEKDTLKEFSYKKFVIDSFSFVYVIEDSAVILVRANPNSVVVPFCSNAIFNWDITFCELTYNDLFRTNKTRLKKSVHFNSDIVYVDYFAERETRLKGIEFVSKSIPFLDIEERNEAWEGIPYLFIVYETQDETGKIGRAIFHTNSMLSTSEALKAALQLQDEFRFKLIDDIKENNEILVEDRNNLVGKLKSSKDAKKREELEKDKEYDIYSDENFKEIITRRLNDLDVDSDIEHIQDNVILFDGRVKYYTIKQNIKELDFDEVNKELLSDLANGKHEEAEKHEYSPLRGIWKNEELMYRCIQNVCKGKTVVYQHHPHFLGHQSYDAYIPELKVAFEYQGQQHFEPVDFFGGKENFEQQVDRDKRKKQLSRENGITLIYVNYDEDVSDELIRRKLEDVNITLG